ncbi:MULTISPECIES: YheT family hydrolase [unclassified Polaromonas]|uniref:YheT family hydrolase n=1 Tax=unclassified Polaromonas TaxID=2638319 RepID=UPI001A319948|nr:MULTISPECIES: alpha/beta fold hydrolase [unclassified Polaromonas]MBG6072336.1 putative alpha/beta-fold hydrolase [Polaromonas sp. CG_9.7]MBG6114233.1 putative alpha/beta-fold hydrolase [Polaromonas sp. CG_9.2]MDH6182809.1 putative alpha/beta-fold hydrolase [Polaromonas sp. CG_23.6]
MNYGAPWWLPEGNMQTIWAALHARRFAGLAPVFQRERWATPDGDFVDVDWSVQAPTLPAARGSLLNVAPPRSLTSCSFLPPEGVTPPAVWQSQSRGRNLAGEAAGAAAPAAPQSRFCGPGLNGPDARASVRPEKASEQPLLVLFHGLEGSSGSHYAQAFADVAGCRGWAFAVPHFRGCSGEMNLAPRAYHSGDYAEIDWILRRFADRHHGPVLAAGVSLGGNALMRWAGEMGHNARQVVAAIASISAPLDLTASGRAIGRGFNRQVYTRMFLKSMRPKALQKLAQHPGLFDRTALLAARDLYAFDNIFTGPVHGFKGVDDYWARASAKPYLRQIAVPALALNALNDPFIPVGSLPRRVDVSPDVTLWQPAQGGHVGFPSSGFPAHVRAMPEAVVDFLAAQL